MYARGAGLPVIVIPGIQGRWEWLRPALDALQSHCRTVSYSLCGDFGSGWQTDPALGFDNYLRQLDDVFERAGLERAALCGSSYGGFIALRYAATRPQRVSHLILSSSPSPGWTPNPRQSRYIATPWMSTPAFVATAPGRLWPEIHAAFDDAAQRLAFCGKHLFRVVSAPAIPSLMAGRIVQQQSMDFTPDCGRIHAPTLVITGEPRLDAVVPVEATKRYLSLIPGAKYAMLERTGHLGLLTHPERFASIISTFIARTENLEPGTRNLEPANANDQRSAWSSGQPRSAAR
jgi:pimeloyl-ACP methyl ester carboxylesterase